MSYWSERVYWAEKESGVYDCVYCDDHPCQCDDEDARFDMWRDMQFDGRECAG